LDLAKVGVAQDGNPVPGCGGDSERDVERPILEVSFLFGFVEVGKIDR
jgi:hypothetical protein